MLPRHHPDRASISFDDHRLVAHAGLILPATLARRLGLPQFVQKHLDLGDAPGRANPGDKLMTLVASALAGGDCIDDADALHSDGTARALGITSKGHSTLDTGAAGPGLSPSCRQSRPPGEWPCTGPAAPRWVSGSPRDVAGVSWAGPSFALLLHGRVQGLPHPLRQVLPAPVGRRPVVGLLLRRQGDLHPIVVSAGWTTRRRWSLVPGRGRFQGPPAPGHQGDPSIFRRPPVGGRLRRADGKQDPLRVASAPPATQIRRLEAGSRGLGPVGVGEVVPRSAELADTG